MKIKQVEYKRLFNIGDYQNETIGFVADIVHDEEKKAIAQLNCLALDIHSAIAKLKKLNKKIEIIYSTGRYGLPCESIMYKEKQIRNYKDYLIKQEDKVKNSTDEMEKLQAKKLLENYKLDIEKETKELKELQELGEQLRNLYHMSMDSFKKGDLSFLKELEAFGF